MMTSVRARLVGLVAGVLTMAGVGSYATTRTVTSLADSGAGSLRDAIAASAANDTINFAVTGTITLTSGELLVSNSVTIAGPGPSNLAVDGNAASRVFHTGLNTTVSISGLTITNGNATGTYPANTGGGIYSENATLIMSNCTLSHNRTDVYGGGIYSLSTSNGSASVEVVNCTLSSNGPVFAGGGICNRADTNGRASVKVVNSLLTDNLGSGGGGGIFNDAEGGGRTCVQIVNSTVSGNVGGSAGNAVDSQAGSGGTATVEIVNSTFSGNRGADSDIIIGGFGGSATLEVGSTILNAGASGVSIRPGSSRVLSLGYNLSSDSGGGFLTATGDQINTDPMLGPLQDNGGPTFTHALRASSPAVDQGKNFSASAVDQRGSPRTFDDSNIANATGGDGTDIGAYEAAQLQMTAAAQAGNDFQLSFTSLLGTNYEVQSRADIVAGTWTSLLSGIPGNGGIAMVTVTNAFDQTQQFYRVHPVP
jgi:hypothetical protein